MPRACPRKPVPEERGEDGFHSKDDRGPRRWDVLLHRRLHQESAGRCQKSGHEQRDPCASGVGKETGAKKGHTMTKSSAMERSWASVSAPASWEAA